MLRQEDKAILFASIIELLECANQEYARNGSSAVFLALSEILNERTERLNG